MLAIPASDDRAGRPRRLVAPACAGAQPGQLQAGHRGFPHDERAQHEPADRREPVGFIDPDLLTAPINVMRVGLHPRGLGRWITNLGQVHAYFSGRLERQVALTGDPALAGLLEEVSSYPAPAYHRDPAAAAAAGQILTPNIRLRTPDGPELSLFATVATFGTATEITTSELSIELAFPADAVTAEALRQLPASG